MVRFIGNADSRIKEDYLRILRFFRFYAEYNQGEIHQESYEACVKLRDGIHSLSSERIYDEIFKTLESNHADRAINAMQKRSIS